MFPLGGGDAQRRGAYGAGLLPILADTVAYFRVTAWLPASAGGRYFFSNTTTLFVGFPEASVPLTVTVIVFPSFDTDRR